MHCALSISAPPGPRSSARARCFVFWAVIVLLLAAVCCPGCHPGATAPASPRRLTIAAASSLADALRELASLFEAANAGVLVDLSFGGSNQLRAQLENGFPGDLFASADRKQMEAAVASHVVDAPTVRLIAENQLALIVPRRNGAGLKGLADLARPGLRIVVADDSVPAGRYTRLMLERAAALPELGPEFVAGVRAGIVSKEENVAAVVAKVVLDEADAGFAYLSEAAGASAAGLMVIPLPPAVQQRAEYLIAVTTRTSDAALAGRFIDFLAAPESVAILRRRGFAGPESGPR